MTTRTSCTARIIVTALTLALPVSLFHPPTALADEASIDSADHSFQAIVERLERTEAQLDRTQQELDDLRSRDAERQVWEESIIQRLPAAGSDYRFTGQAADSLSIQGTSAGSYGAASCDCPPDCCVCPQPEKPPIVVDLAKGLLPASTDCGEITFKPGLRIQSRYLYDDGTNNNDFFIRRFRLKSSGDAFGIAKYGAEFKVDSTGKFNTDHDPDGVVENAWLDFMLMPEVAYLHVGLYDIPFSRNALTSDSKLLLMDRTLIKGTLTQLGMSDNTIGMMLHGRPRDGQLEYMIGVFDNQKFEQFNLAGNTFDRTVALDSNQLMPAGRLVLNLLDPAPASPAYADYRESYIGEGQRLAVGSNFAYLGSATFDADGAADDLDVAAWGVDLYYNSGPWVFQAEIDWFKEDRDEGLSDVDGDGWYVQGGYIVCCPLELVARYQESDILASDGTISNRLGWTSVGANYYLAEHNLKIQADYTFKDEDVSASDNNVFQVQLQLDY